MSLSSAFTKLIPKMSVEAILILVERGLNELQIRESESQNMSASSDPKKKQIAKLKTEDLGDMFEMAICKALEIPYNKKYKYGTEIPERLKPRLAALKDLITKPNHNEERHAVYDFVSLDNPAHHLSAKTSKKGKQNGRIAPQQIGQPQPKKFCEVLGIDYTDNYNLKKYIQENIQIVLPKLLEYTPFPMVYYNEHTDNIKYITLKDANIDWSQYKYSWTRPYDDWTNSSQVKIELDGNTYPLVEFQFHSASRTNMANRWFFENFLKVFKNKLDIIEW
jgi:hypothetical protein